MPTKVIKINDCASISLVNSDNQIVRTLELDFGLGLIFWGFKQAAGEYLRDVVPFFLAPDAPKSRFHDINYAYVYINGFLLAFGINPKSLWLDSWVADQPDFDQNSTSKLEMFALLAVLAQKHAPPLATAPGASQQSIAQIKYILKEATDPASEIAKMLNKIGVSIQNIIPTARALDATSPGIGTAINDPLFTQEPLTNLSQLCGKKGLLEEICRALNKRAKEVNFNQEELIILTKIFGEDTAKQLLKAVNLQVDSASDQINEATSLHVLQPADSLAYDFTVGLIEALHMEFGGQKRVFPSVAVKNFAKSVQNFLVLPQNGYVQRLATGETVLSNWSESLQNDETGDVALAHRFKVKITAFKMPRHHAVMAIV
jgi:hypothetical protein